MKKRPSPEFMRMLESVWMMKSCKLKRVRDKVSFKKVKDAIITDTDIIRLDIKKVKK